jgi:hypothetical protein
MDMSSRYYTAKVDHYYEVRGEQLYASGLITQPLWETGEYMEPEYDLDYVLLVDEEGTEIQLSDFWLDSYPANGPDPSRYTWRFLLEAEIFKYIEDNDLWVRGDSKADREDYNE